MAAHENNKYWLLRERHGRNKIYESIDELEPICYDYFQWCDDNPWLKQESIKSGELAGTTMDIATARPYTVKGLLIHIGISQDTWTRYKNESFKDFCDFFELIENIIYTQKFEGAAVGAFNAAIIARDLGLKDRQELDHTTKGESINKKADLSKLKPETLKAIAKELDEDGDNS